uniref:Uncharacterized protein n=1 Tax=Rhodopseudomonas palustris (strain BisA53) TaxID=316055 RepID=Q07PN9_RHOP5
MKSNLSIAGLVLATFAATSASYGRDDECASFTIEQLAAIQDGQTYVYRRPTGWEPFSSVAALNLGGATTLRMFHVVRPFSGVDRSGILVVKSNRPAVDTDKEDVTKRVHLAREGVPADRDCKPPAYFPSEGQWVSTRAYEDYHDYPAPDTAALRQDGNEKTIRSFHFEYKSGAQRKCVRTDNDSPDARPWNSNSNRAQFSFNERVVSSGMHSAWRLEYPVPSPFVGAAENRTRAVKYQTEAGLACVGFSLKVVPVEYTIRINDLEGREAPPSNRRLPEKRWP